MKSAGGNRLTQAVFSPVSIWVWVIVSLSLGLTGAFGTYERFSLAPRLGIWFLLVGVAVALGVSLRVFCEVVRPNWSYACCGFLASALTAAIYAVTAPWFWPALWSMPLTVSQLEAFALVLVVGAGTVVYRMFMRKEVGAIAGNACTAPKILSRLPDGLDGPILHLSVDDHYVEVVTPNGSGRVLMRFADALDEVEPMEGLRVHRSHWVARNAIARVVREGSRVFVELSNGARVPVSRGYRNEVDALLGN